MSIDTPPSPVPADAEALLASAEGMGDNEIRALVARVVIDALGRPWDPLKHPRDAEGKFIETFAEVRGLFHTSGGAKGAPKVSGRVVAFDHNGDVWVRVDHVADGYTEHKPGDLVPIKPDDIQALDKLASIPKSLDGEQRTQIEALAARMEGRNPDAAAALRRAADPANTQPIAQLADLHEARDALDADGSSEAVAVRDMVWDLSDQLGDHPDNDEVIKAAQAMVRDHLAKEPTKNAEAIARLDGDIHAEAPPAQPSAPDAAQRLAGQLHGLADRLQDQNPADAVHVRNVAAKLGDIGVTGETPEKRDSRLEAAATQALKINNAQLKKKIIADIKHMRENPPQKDAPAEQAPDAAPKARLEPPSAAEPLPPVQTPGPDVPATPDVPEAPPTPPETPATPEARVNVPSAPSDPAASDPPVDSAPDDPEDVTPDDLEAEASIPAEVARPVAGDVGNGLAFENMPHGLVLSGDTYKNRQTIKDVGGFRWTEVPGQKDGKGQPLKAWTATGTEDQRYAALAKLADALGVPDPGQPGAAADAPDEEYPPTPQQQEIIDAVYTGQDVVVRALAGTGKTSTLRMLARRLFKSDPGKRIVYVAFNKSIQEEAQKTMPSNVEARTGDSIAFATMSPAMKAKLNDKTLLRRNKDIADFLGIKAPLDMGPGQPPLSPEEQAMRIMRAIEKYSISADDELGTKHFENLPLDVADVLLPYARKAWMDVTSDNGRIRATFSHFTKLWALSRPDFTKTTSGLKRKADIIFFDEAQDINPVMAKVIADQKIQKVYVGDGNQAIYGFRGAEDQLDKVKAEHDLPLTKSWRFGPQIAGMGNRFLALIGSKHRIEGAGPEGKVLDPDTMADPDAILVRSNAGAIGEILAAQTEGKLVGVPKGTKGDLRRLVDTARWLQQGGNPPAQVHDDLAAFRTWDEVRKAAEDGDDPKVKMLYGIIEENGIPALDDLVNRLIDTSDKADNRTPDLVVTTAHKSKGLEWDKVKIGGDFRGPRIDKKTGDLIMPSPEEMRLAYVAVTRAQKELDPGSLAWVYDYTNENGEEVKPETPTPAPESPADLPSSPERWSTPPSTPDTTPAPPAPSASPAAEIDHDAADAAYRAKLNNPAYTDGSPEYERFNELLDWLSDGTNLTAFSPSQRADLANARDLLRTRKYGEGFQALEDYIVNPANHPNVNYSDGEGLEGRRAFDTLQVLHADAYNDYLPPSTTPAEAPGAELPSGFIDRWKEHGREGRARALRVAEGDADDEDTVAAMRALAAAEPVDTPIYRGLEIADKQERADFVAAVEKNGYIEPLASFTTDLETALNFGHGFSVDRGTPAIVIHVDGPNKHIAIPDDDEFEVLSGGKFEHVSTEIMEDGSIALHVRQVDVFDPDKPQKNVKPTENRSDPAAQVSEPPQGTPTPEAGTDTTPRNTPETVSPKEIPEVPEVADPAVDTSGVAEEDRAFYADEHCEQLAYAIHEKTGWPIYVVTDGMADPNEDGAVGWVHAVVQTPDGNFLDVDGAHSGGALLDQWAEAFAGQDDADADNMDLIEITPEHYAVNAIHPDDDGRAARVADELLAAQAPAPAAVHPGPTMLDRIIQAARDGGFTFDPRNKDFKTDGFAVARQGLGEHFSIADPEIDAKIDAFIDKHWDTFAADAGAYLGGWENEGEIWLDVPDVLDSREDAIAEGTKRFEIAIADLAAYARGEDGEIRLQYAERPPRGTPAHNDWTDLEGVRHVEPESAADSAPAGAGRDEGPVQGPGEAGPGSPDGAGSAGDLGVVPDGWEQGKNPYNGEPDNFWGKDDYVVFTGQDNGAPGLRIAEFDRNQFVVWRANADDWADVERQIAAHEDLKANGGLEQKDRDQLARLAESYGMGADLIDAIRSGTPDQIQSALEQDAKYAEMKSAYLDAQGADAWNADQKKAFEDWFQLNVNVLLKLKQAKLLVGEDQPAPAAQEAPDTRTPAAPEVPAPQPEVPAYSGEIRDIQPRDLGEIVNAVDDAQRWLEGYYQDNYIRPGNDGEQKAFDAVKEALGNVGDAVREGNFDNAQVNLEALRSEIEREGVEPQFRDDMGAYADQIQGVLDKVAQRDKGQFEIPGVAQPSAAPYVEHAQPELNAAFDDMLDTNPEAAKNLKDLRQALDYFYTQVDHDNEYEQAVGQVIQAINNHDYQGALDKLNDVIGQRKFPSDSDPYADQPERYSDFGGFTDVENAAYRVLSDLEAVRAAQAPEEPQVPASQEPLAEWEKELLKDLEPTPTPAEKDELSKWKDAIAELDGDPLFQDDENIGMMYNDIVQDEMVDDPAAIENELRELARIYRAAKLPKMDDKAARIDEVIRKVAPGPESNVPGPYDPAADPEVVLPDVPGDGTPIKDERRVIDPRVRGEIEDVKRGVGLPELPDRLDIDRNGAAVFALDLVDVPAAGKQGKGERRRPPGIGQVRRIYTKNGVRYAEVAFYDPKFIDYPDRNAAKAKKGLKNNSPFYVWDGIRIDKIQKVDGSNPDAQDYLAHLGPEEQRQYAGRNAGRLAQNRGRVRPELERMANLKYIGDRYAPDADGLMVGKGDIVLYNGKKYEVARVNHNPKDGDGNTRLDLVPIGDDGAPELQAGGKHAEPYARMVRFYDQPVGDRPPGVTVDEIKDLVRRLDANGKYIVGQPMRDALDNSDFKEIARWFNEDPALLNYMADGRAYINDYIQRLLNANLRGDFKGIDRHEQEMVRKDKNDLLNAMAAVEGRFLEGTGADRHIRRELPAGGPDQEYQGNRPEVLMPLRYVQAKNALADAAAAHPEDAGLWDAVKNAMAHAGALNLDDEDNYWAAIREFEALRRGAGGGGLNAPEFSDALGALTDAMDAWHEDQLNRRAMVQGGPGGEARLPGGRTIAPGLVRVPGKSNVPAPQNDADRAYADRLVNDPDVRARYQRLREALDQASSDVRDANPDFADYLDEANRALMAGNYGEAFHAVDNVLAVPVGHPNEPKLAEWQEALAQVDHYVGLNAALHDIQRIDWPQDYFPDTAEINAGKAPAEPAAPAAPDNRAEIDQTNPVHNIVNFFARNPYGEGNLAERQAIRNAVQAWNDGNAPTPEDRKLVRDYLVKRAEVEDDPVLKQNMNDWINYFDRGVAPAAPAAPAVPKKPAVDLPDDLRRFIHQRGNHVIPQEAKDAADALNAGMAPNAPDLEALHDAAEKGIARGDNPDRYRELKHWLDTYAPRGDAAAEPESPAGPREAADIRQAFADAVEARYKELRADRKNNEARKQALDVEDIGADLDAALDKAVQHNERVDEDGPTERDAEMAKARGAVNNFRDKNPELAAELDRLVDEIQDRFSRDDDEHLVDRYMREAEKFHGQDKPDNDQRDRMLKAAQGQVDRIKRYDAAKGAELDAKIKDYQDRYAVDDVERARAKPVGRTQAIDEFDAAVEAERKRLRDEKKNAEARALAKDADQVAEALNDAEDAHKAGDVAEREAAIERARAAAEVLDPTNPDLAEIARRAVEGNAARFAREDARGAAGTADDEIDTTPQGDAIKRAAKELHDIAAKRGVKGWVKGQRGGYRLDELQRALIDAKRAGEIQSVTSLGSEGFNGNPLEVVLNNGQRVVIKNDATGHGARAEQVLGRMYRGLGFKQPLVTAMTDDVNDDLRHFIVMEHLDDLGGYPDEGAGDVYNFDEEGKREAFDIQLANAIMASTDRHPGNIMHGPDENGRERLWLYDNGIALFNGAFGEPFGGHVPENHHDRDYANRQGDYGYVDPAVTPAQFILSSRARGGVYVGHNSHSAGKISVDWMEGKSDDEIRSEIEQFVDRMTARAAAMKFLTPEEIEFITVRGGWAKDNWQEIIDAMYELRNKTRTHR